MHFLKTFLGVTKIANTKGDGNTPKTLIMGWYFLAISTHRNNAFTPVIMGQGFLAGPKHIFTEIYGENLGELPSLDLWNASLNWEEIAGLPLDVSLFGTNLSDEEYYGFVPGLGANGLETAVLGQPRMYGLRLRYRFGGE